MLSTLCLLALLATYVCARIIERVVRRLDLDVWEALVYLGLAEWDEPPAARKPRGRLEARGGHHTGPRPRSSRPPARRQTSANRRMSASRSADDA